MLKKLLIAFCLLILTGCYSPKALELADIVYRLDSRRTPIMMGNCIQNSHMLERAMQLKENFAFLTAPIMKTKLIYDERADVADITAMNPGLLNGIGDVWLWRIVVSPTDQGGSHIKVQSLSSIWKPFVTDDTFKIIEDCSSWSM